MRLTSEQREAIRKARSANVKLGIENDPTHYSSNHRISPGSWIPHGVRFAASARSVLVGENLYNGRVVE